MEDQLNKKQSDSVWFWAGIFFIVVLVFFAEVLPEFSPYYYERTVAAVNKVPVLQDSVTHVKTPYPVKGIYMSQCTAGDKKLRQKLVDLINNSELNSLVIDVKDYAGGLAFLSEEPIFKDKVSKICTIEDLPEFLEELHRAGIYVIARVTVFQDPLMASLNPDIAVKLASATSTNWKDRKGISYIDPGAEEMWKYILAVARKSYALGFDEINFDYVRFPSDGNMNDIFYPISEKVVEDDPDWGKAYVMKRFFSYLGNELKKEGIPSSVDLFGMTTTNTDDLNIGQVLEDTLPYIDYVSPMVYPSHYPTNFIGIFSPAAKPYEVVKYSMDRAFKRASTTAWKMRPWLQDFDLGAIYTADMVRAQIQAVYDAGFDSWLLWDASNSYTPGALYKEEEV